ncbi:5-hydroxyisourate hydrolase [Blastococcus aurantiacus]|uniref:5-hydroxyisourate hydrolase n=1 Tax=Blastococcus aurantiacus TaxID=1550231 RepID=A0A1G7QXE3_9ACTN|nr:hydroxyisourate hydrolase [Blastococcus aurantiacus]SDG02559.1 5-hydroxyisourate hydrolase [Blastococcus aurantiacus]
MSTFSTHVLDAVLGRPAAGMDVALALPDGSTIALRTDDDGRARVDADLPAGEHSVRFGTGSWFADQQRDTFFPAVTVIVALPDGEHTHVALLLSPFAYTTYRGS